MHRSKLRLVAILLDQLGAYNASRNHSWIKGEGGGEGNET